MAVELDGNVRMRGDTGPGAGVRIFAGEGRLRLVLGREPVGDWRVEDIGINALQDGFNVKAEGEEFILRTEDDVALAEELSITAVSPRLARRLAARHNPTGPDFSGDEPRISPHLAAIGFAVAGAMIVLGGTLLNVSAGPSPTLQGLQLWVIFVVGGMLMIATSYMMSTGSRLARPMAAIVLSAVVVLFGVAVSDNTEGSRRLAAYGLVAGGLVVGVAVLGSGSLRQSE